MSPASLAKRRKYNCRAAPREKYPGRETSPKVGGDPFTEHTTLRPHEHHRADADGHHDRSAEELGEIGRPVPLHASTP